MSLLYICMSVCIYSVIFCLIFCIICKKVSLVLKKYGRLPAGVVRCEMTHGCLPTENRERPPTPNSRSTLAHQMREPLDQPYQA